MQRGTLVRVYPVSLAGTCLPSWVGRIEKIHNDEVVAVSNGTRTDNFVHVSEIKEISEVLPVPTYEK
jgi:hypothetical protein